MIRLFLPNNIPWTALKFLDFKDKLPQKTAQFQALIDGRMVARTFLWDVIDMAHMIKIPSSCHCDAAGIMVKLFGAQDGGSEHSWRPHLMKLISLMKRLDESLHLVKDFRATLCSLGIYTPAPKRKYPTALKTKVLTTMLLSMLLRAVLQTETRIPGAFHSSHDYLPCHPMKRHLGHDSRELWTNIDAARFWDSPNSEIHFRGWLVKFPPNWEITDKCVLDIFPFRLYHWVSLPTSPKAPFTVLFQGPLSKGILSEHTGFFPQRGEI